MYPTRPSRWCPTPEQLMILEEMYRGGIRTPKSAQIQAITAHLSLYGKIEGKNVFYWFQNHKARDRQKLRKKLMLSKVQSPSTQQNTMTHHHFAHPQLFYYVPVPILNQVGSLNSSVQMLPQSLQLDPNPNQRLETKENMIKMNGSDWFVKLDVGPTNKPLRTLELFPTTSVGLKRECTEEENVSSTSSHES